MNDMLNSLWRERIFLCLAVLASYATVWPNEFVYDDKMLILLNAFLKHWNTLPRLLTSASNAGAGGTQGGFYRPIPMLVYFLFYQAFGPATLAFHALNIGLQAFNACLLHHFGIRAGFRKGAAFAAALLWAVHPLHISVVAYMSSTPELLSGTFCLLGLIRPLPDFAPRRSGAEQIPGAFAPRQIWQAIIFYMLALGCKESAVVFPALATITFFFASKDRAQISAYLRTGPLWLAAACYITIWLCFIHQSGYTMDVSKDSVHYRDYVSNFTNRVFTSLATLPVYARLIVWPTGLHIERTFPIFYTLLAWQPLTGALMVGLSLIQILRQRGLALSFGLLWFAVALSPVTGIVFPLDALINEGWLYLPTMGLFLGITQTAAGFFENRKNAARCLVGVIAISLGLTTLLQNRAWRNTEMLYQNILQNGGNIDHISYHAGLFNLKHHAFDKAVEQFQYLIDHPDGRSALWRADVHVWLAVSWLQIDLGDDDVLSIDKIVRALPSSPHIPAAIAELNNALQDNPDSYWVHDALAAIYRYQGNNQMADLHQKQVDALLKKQGNARH